MDHETLSHYHPCTLLFYLKPIQSSSNTINIDDDRKQWQVVKYARVNCISSYASMMENHCAPQTIDLPYIKLLTWLKQHPKMFPTVALEDMLFQGHTDYKDPDQETNIRIHIVWCGDRRKGIVDGLKSLETWKRQWGKGAKVLKTIEGVYSPVSR